METTPQSEAEREAKRDAVRVRRLQTLTGVWQLLIQKEWFNPHHLKLSFYLAAETVEHYLNELEVLKGRYKIDDLIQVPKVAGLMTEAIVRLRPIVPLVDDCFTRNQMLANEILAIVNGLAICAEQTARAGGEFLLVQEPWFDGWFKNFLFLLHHRHYTPESLNFIYETLCWFRFPESMVMPAKAETGGGKEIPG